MTRGIRDRHKQLTREAILEACAGNIAERGLMDFSIPEIAESAGVSLRTLYNYFPDRQTLIEALMAWAEETFSQNGGFSTIESLDQLPDAVRVNFRLFSEMQGLYQAFAMVDSSTNDAFRLERERRTDAFAAAARKDLRNLSDARVAEIAMLLRSLGSSRFWRTLTGDRGLDGKEAGELASWAVAQIVEAARKEDREAGESDGANDDESDGG